MRPAQPSCAKKASVDPPAQEAELVALRVGQAEELQRLQALGARQVDVGQRDAPWIVLVAAGRVHVDVQAVLDRLRFRHRGEDQQRRRRLASFWADVLGWPIVEDPRGYCWLSSTGAPDAPPDPHNRPQSHAERFPCIHS